MGRRPVRSALVRVVLALAVAAATILVAPQTPADAAAGSSTLRSNEALTAGQSLRSPMGRYRAVMQYNGNLVVYRNSDGVALWATGTTGAGSSVRMQTDGNLVVYTSAGVAKWSSQTAPSRNDKLVMQDDGNLVLYSRGGLPLWASRGGRTAYSQNILPTGGGLGTGQSLWSPNGKYRAVMQSNGNLVVYRSDGVVDYSTRTTVAGSRLQMQADGNLVVYTPGGTAQWASNTAPSSHDTLVLQDDGNLVLRSKGGLPLWASRGGKTAFRQNLLPTEGRMTAGQTLWSPNLQHAAVMQGDGNFVVYRSGGIPEWATGTNVAGSYLRMQGDGNLVVYTPGNVAKWSSDTAPSSGDVLVMQDDGNLVIYAAGNTSVWASRGVGGGETPSLSTGGYPDADAVDCSAKYGKYSWCKNGAQYSSRGMSYRNCTDFAAWRRGMVWSQIQSAGTGHAYAWKQGWIDRGRAVGTTPRVGAVAWWGASRGSGYGHVGIVLAVNADGSARVEQYNGDGNGTYSVVNTRAEAYLY